MRVIQRVLSRREKIAQLIANLELLRDRGEIRDDEFDTLRAEYEHLQAEAETNIQAIREHVRNKELALRQNLRELDDEARKLDLRHKVGEITAMQAERAHRKLDAERDAAERKILRIEAALNAQTSADIGGYIDVDIRARIEPDKGILGDELDAPEIVGAAQKSLKEWQGRAHELVASARIRGKELLDRDEVATAKTTLRSLAERAKTHIDTAAERAANTINQRLAKHGRNGISATALKAIIAIALLIALLFILTRDAYPKTPSKVLQAAWQAANQGDIAQAEQYLSINTLGWLDDTLAMMPGKSLETIMRDKWDQRTRHQTIQTLEILSEDIRGTTATVNYILHFNDGTKSAPRQETLIREDGRWKIQTELGDFL